MISTCLARPGMAAWSMNIMVGGLQFDSMRCQIFLTTHMQLAVSSLVGQYHISVLFSVQDRKRIGSMAVLGGYRPPGCMFVILAVGSGSCSASVGAFVLLLLHLHSNSLTAGSIGSPGVIQVGLMWYTITLIPLCFNVLRSTYSAHSGS